MNVESYRATSEPVLVLTQYLPENPEGRHFIPHIQPMVLLSALQGIVLIASAVIMTRSEEWQMLAGLALGSAIGGVFGLLYTAFARSANKVPWQIMAWRGILNVAGGLGFGSIAIVLQLKWGWDVGPLLTIATGFITAWLAVGIARFAEPKLMRILEERGDILKPLPPEQKPVVLKSETTKLE